jgi:sortase A
MKKRSTLRRFIGIGSAICGLLVLAYVMLPIISYRLSDGTQFNDYLSPVPDGSQAFDQTSEVLASEGVDYTKASNWFEAPKDDFDSADISKVRFYNLSIPKLGIKGATVAIGGEDLEESLIQYPGTALPGKKGNAVIFGHSILPQFFNPKDYLSIFSTLPTMKKGDNLSIRYDGITYGYIVEEVFEVKPTDLEILAQNTSDSYVTLVTCTPPGHPLRPKRLIVRARIDPNASLTHNLSNDVTWN